MTEKRCAVIGAGLGGLAAAIRLAHLGVQVDLFEMNPQVGGKAGVLELDGGLSDLTTFDMARGLSWAMGGGRTRTEDMGEWLGKRAGVGKKPPHGFPRNNRFD